MGWFDDAVDWVGDNVGGIAQGAGVVYDYISGSDKEKDVKKQADRQADELTRVAEANREISLYDAEVARRMGMKARFEKNAQAGLMYKDLNKLMASQRVRYAKSGVAIDKGTPVDVMEETLINGARDIMNIKYDGQSAKAKADSLAKRYKLLADKGLRDAAAQASLLEEAAEDSASAIRWDTYGGMLNKLGNIGIQYNWF